MPRDLRRSRGRGFAAGVIGPPRWPSDGRLCGHRATRRRVDDDSAPLLLRGSPRGVAATPVGGAPSSGRALSFGGVPSVGEVLSGCSARTGCDREETGTGGEESAAVRARANPCGSPTSAIVANTATPAPLPRANAISWIAPT
ncbi:hypothetical protein IOD13_13410 [Brevibacterium casei]|nr:hypothetical protein [Brevibacterium casei]